MCYSEYSPSSLFSNNQLCHAVVNPVLIFSLNQRVKSQFSHEIDWKLYYSEIYTYIFLEMCWQVRTKIISFSATISYYSHFIIIIITQYTTI